MNEIQKPKGEFRRYIQWNGRMRCVYIISTHWQINLFGEKVKMVEFKLSKNSRTVHAAERKHFQKTKPTTRKENSGIA
jgi:hypothetical protein